MFDEYLRQVRQRARGYLDEDAARELRAHFEATVAEHRAAGLASEEAEAAALATLGRPAAVARAFRRAAAGPGPRLAGGPAWSLRMWRLADEWWLLVLAALVAGLGAYTYLRLPWIEPRWTASAWVRVNGRVDYASALRRSREIGPLAESVRQPGIMQEVESQLDPEASPEWLLAHTHVTASAEQSMIRIDVEDADPIRAERIVQEVLAVYIHQHNAAQQRRLPEEQTVVTPADTPLEVTLAWWSSTYVLVPLATIVGLLTAGVAVTLSAPGQAWRGRGR